MINYPGTGIVVHLWDGDAYAFGPRDWQRESNGGVLGRDGDVEIEIPATSIKAIETLPHRWAIE